ncbi:hypothetical protein [Paenibacillus sp. NPDC057967]|uniref:hypothetical protein n=1 Tax=Paenibacillus sp. NPDC057967 TaxID=3346293 RepID=UPI0036DC3D4F
MSLIYSGEKFIWAIFVADSTRSFPNFYPIGIFLSREGAVSEMENLPKDHHYQLLKLPVNQLFPYYHKATGKIVGMEGIHHEHFEGNE